MKAFKALAIILLLTTSAHAGKRVQFDVCAIDGGKLGVYETTDKQAEALVLARYLEKKSGGKRHYFVVIEQLDAKGDVK